jgi:hypothetical protein
MTPPDRDDRALAALDALIDEITVDAHGDDEKFWAFRQAFEDNIVVPGDAFVIGEPVSVIAFEYDGNARRLTARCRRADAAEHVVANAFRRRPIQVPGVCRVTAVTTHSLAGDERFDC